MSWRSFALGFVAAAIGCAAFMTWTLRRPDLASQHWVLPSASFVDIGEVQPGSGYLMFAGSLGPRDSISSAYNIFQGVCNQAEGVCRTASVQRLGYNQLSDIDQSSFGIVKWTPDLIVAESGENSPLCVTITLNIRRIDEAVEYVRTPKSPSPDRGRCQSLKQETQVWKIINPPPRGELMRGLVALLLVIIPIPSLAQPTKCSWSQRHQCSQVGPCVAVVPKTWGVFDSEAKTYQRCDRSGCDAYPVTVNQLGSYRVVGIDGSGSFMKVGHDGTATEVVSLGVNVLVSHGTCR